MTSHSSSQFHSSNNQGFQDVPIAIVGMACIFPQAGTTSQFWSNILEGRDAIREVPLSHWRASDYFNADQKAPDMTYSQRGAFLDPIDFAPLDFGIAPKNLEAIDTTQLLGLVVARDALADSGYGSGGKTFNRHRASVILGVTGTLEMVIPLGARLGHPIWRKSLTDCGVDADTAEKVVDRIGEHYNAWQENSFPGLLGNVTAGRIANRLDLGGTNCVVDAACASSLGAVHLAQMELATGRSDMVVTGGFDTFNDIFMFMCFSKTPALSKSGHARPFDQSADGTSLGEGLGAVVLKRLSDAERDGDRIYAVIRGLGTSSDGIGQAVYAPKAEGQVRCLKSAYANSGVDPSTVELVEAHGTGTKVGDGIEVKALSEVYQAASAKESGRWCAVGSVKSQIGHTKAAAGVAGLIKAALALHHKVIPPTIKVDNPADEILAENAPFYVPTEPRPWPARKDHPRRAAVSAFGFGGSNFHAVLEEVSATTDEIGWSDHVDIWPVSADSLEHLREQIQSIPESAAWKVLQRHAAKGRQTASAMETVSPWRLAIVLNEGQSWASQRSSILEALSQANPQSHISKVSPLGWTLGSGPSTGKLALIFSGQGSQKVGMLRDAACRFPLLARTLDESDDAAQRGPGTLISKIYPVHLLNKEAKANAEKELTRTEIAQPAISALSLGLARVLGDFGVSPHGLAGHSLGELTALAASGRLTPKQVHRLVDLRGRAMAKAADSANARHGKGGMLAILAEENQWSDLLTEPSLQGQVFVANRNAPAQTVVSGSESALVRLESLLKSRNIRSKLLTVGSAFHSPWVESASEELTQSLQNCSWRSSPLAVYQNTTAGLYPESQQDAFSLLANQLARPVEFVKMIRQMEADGYRSFLEIGPDSRLTGLIQQSLVNPDGSEVFAFSETPTAQSASAILDLAKTLGRLWTYGQKIQWSKWQPESTGLRLQPEKKTLTVELTGANLRPVPSEMKPVSQPKTTVKLPLQSEIQDSEPASSLLELPAQSTRMTGQAESYHSSRKQLEKSNLSDKSPVIENLLSDSIVLKENVRMKPQELANIHSNSSTGEALLALQKLMEQNAAVHSQFLATQKHAQETVRILLGLAPGSLPEEHNHLANGNSKSGLINGLTHKPVSAPMIKPEPVQGQMPESTVPSGIPIPQPSTVFSSPSPVNLEEDDPGLDVFAPPPAVSPVSAHSQPVTSQTASLQSVESVTRLEEAKSSTNPLATLLLEIVSEKTGYPLEMLDLDQQLDADLGIDSIKRVEILSAIQEKRSDLPHVRTDQFGALRRLRDVVDLLDAVSPDLQATSSTPVAATQNSNVSQSAQVAPVSHGQNARLTEIVREVISEKTGYPVEMLEMEMQLDTDLGIDSIKRVEILSGIQERLPHIPHMRTDQFGALLTIGDIIKALTELDSPPPDGSGGSGGNASISGSHRAAVREVATSSVKTSRLLASEIDSSQNRNRYQPVAGSKVIVLSEESELSTALVRSFSARGMSARRIGSDEIDQIDPPDKLFGLVLATSGEYSHAAFGRVLRLVQKCSSALLNSGRETFSFVAGLTFLDGRFGLDPDVDSEDLSGWPTASMSGLVKTLAWEWPEVAARVLDIDPRWADWQPGDAANLIVDEILTDGPVERGLTDPESHPIVTTALVPMIHQGQTDVVSLQQMISPRDVVLVTGGARGVTAEVAAAFAESVAPTLVLLGRSAQPEAEPLEFRDCQTESSIVSVLAKNNKTKKSPAALISEARKILADREVRKNLERFEQLGATVVYRSVDLQDAIRVKQVISSIESEFGSVQGVIHGAGVLADKRVEDLTADACAPVLETKVKGLQNVLAGIDQHDLKFVCLFSSITARVGRTGQAAYAAANEMLNKFAIHNARIHPSCRWLSLGWGPWDGGMVTPALKKVFESEGVGLIPLEGGSWTLLELLGGHPTNAAGVEVLVLEGEGKPVTPSRKIPELIPHESSVKRSQPVRNSGQRLIWEKKANLCEWPVLKDHVINGSPVIPTALLTEWLIEGAMHVLPGLELESVRQMKVLKGVVLSPESLETIQLWVDFFELHENGGAVAQVAIRGLFSDTGRSVDHARAEVVLSLQEHTLSRPEWLVAQPAKVWNNPYQGLLFHGSDFQVLDGPVRYDESRFLARLKKGSLPHQWLKSPSRSQWLVDPLVLDGIMQGLCGWPKLTGSHFSLPMGFETLRWKRMRPDDFTGGFIAMQLNRQNDHEVRANAVVLSAAGEMIGSVEGIRGIMDANLADAFLRNITKHATGC